MANPTLSKFDKIDFGRELAKEGGMTVHGTAAKTGVLLALAFVTAALSWKLITNDHSLILPLLLGGALPAMICAMIGTFFPKSAPITAPLYALFEGLALGAISLLVSGMVEKKVGSSHIVLQATLLTFGVMAAMLALYGFRIIKVTGKLVAVILAATAAVGLFYLVMMFVRIFSPTMAFSFTDGGGLSIAISLVVIAIAAFNLLLDFDFIEKHAQAGMPKYMEWYGALGLMVTLVWLYLEILKLLSKLNSRN